MSIAALFDRSANSVLFRSHLDSIWQCVGTCFSPSSGALVKSMAYAVDDRVHSANLDSSVHR